MVLTPAANGAHSADDADAVPPAAESVGRAAVEAAVQAAVGTTADVARDVAGEASTAAGIIAEPTDLAGYRDAYQWALDALLAELERSKNLSAALLTNRRIGVAIGILMTAGRITQEAAFDQLRVVSQRQNRKLRDIADDVIFGGALPEDRPP